jgi:oligopeptide/dipeptide ABC transporter ATP-binding protein
MDETVLRVRDLRTQFRTRSGTVDAVSDVTFEVRRGETVALVGESGSGKSVTALSILQLLESTGSISQGSIEFLGRELVGLSEKELRSIRGRDISMIFQDPSTCLDPVFTIEDQLVETLTIHGKRKTEAKARALELLRLVRMPDPEARLASFPHELSGGQRQRAMIAMSLALNPKLIIADEPTTALDVTVQAQILDLLRLLQKETGAAVLFVTHDLGVVAEIADRVVVMYAGQVVEQGSVRDVLKDPQNPYTAALLASMPGMVAGTGARLMPIEGVVPSLFDMPTGCRFGPRCPHEWSACQAEAAPLVAFGNQRESRCWLRVPEVAADRDLGQEVPVAPGGAR